MERAPRQLHLRLHCWILFEIAGVASAPNVHQMRLPNRRLGAAFVKPISTTQSAEAILGWRAPDLRSYVVFAVVFDSDIGVLANRARSLGRSELAASDHSIHECQLPQTLFGAVAVIPS